MGLRTALGLKRPNAHKGMEDCPFTENGWFSTMIAGSLAMDEPDCSLHAGANTGPEHDTYRDLGLRVVRRPALGVLASRCGCAGRATRKVTGATAKCLSDTV